MDGGASVKEALPFFFGAQEVFAAGARVVGFSHPLREFRTYFDIFSPALTISHLLRYEWIGGMVVVLFVLLKLQHDQVVMGGVWVERRVEMGRACRN